MIKAVIFDFDGVIGDTMQDNFNAWEKAFLLYGVMLNPIDYYLLEGMGPVQISRFFIDKHDLDPVLQNEIIKAKELNYAQNNKFKVFPEIFSILTLLENNGIKTAIVTGASKQRLFNSLDSEILDNISTVVTSDDVINVKPHPEPYLKAVEKLNVSSQECLVVENAKLGIRSAKAAGCKCFALETTLCKDHLLEADEVFTNHLTLLNKFISLFEVVSISQSK